MLLRSRATRFGATRVGTTTSARLALASALAAAFAALLPACSRVAPIASYEYGVPLSLDRSAGAVNPYRVDVEGTSTNHTGGFGVVLEQDDILGGVLSARARLALSNGRFTSNTVNDVADEAIPSFTSRYFDVYSSLSVAQLDLPVLFPLDETISIGVGPWASWRLSSGFLQTEYIVSPSTALFPDGERSRTIRGGESIAGAPVRAGLLALLGVALPVGERLVLRPELFGRLDVMAIGADLGLRSVSGGIAVTATLAPTVDAPLQPLAVIDTPRTITPPAAPRATIELRLENDEALTGRGTLERLEVPLRPVVPFADGSTSIASATTRESALRLTVDSLAQLPAAAIQARVLDVVAMRMREHPTTVATVHGARRRGEAAGLAERRAAAVREYLMEVWGIDSSRLRIGRVEEGGAVARLALDDEIAGPVVTRWVTRSYSAPRVGLRRTIDAPAGVRYWEIVLRQGPRVVGRISDASGDSILMTAVTLEGGLIPIIGEITVVDSTGAVARASDTLTLRDRAQMGAVSTERREVVIATDERLAERARAIASTVRAGAAVTVSSIGGAPEAGGTAAHTPVRLATLLLDELERRGIPIESLRVAGADAPTQAPPPLSGGLRVVVEQPYRPNDN